MKVRSGFVSNSSSSSYIVAVPEEESFDDIDLTKLPEDEKSIVKNILNRIKRSENSYFHYDNDEYELVEDAIQVLSKMGYILNFIEEGPEETHVFYNVLTGEPRKIINKILGGGNESL